MCYIGKTHGIEVLQTNCVIFCVLNWKTRGIEVLRTYCFIFCMLDWKTHGSEILQINCVIFLIVLDWKTHGSEYYECSRYKENPNIANESAHAQAREALKKYIFYFERVGKLFLLS